MLDGVDPLLDRLDVPRIGKHERLLQDDGPGVDLLVDEVDGDPGDLHPVLERLLDTLSFEAPDRDGQSVVVDAAYVNTHLGELVQDPDLSRYIL